MDDMSSPVYYRIYLNRDGLLVVVCMQDFDEPDYDQNKFLKRPDGTARKWSSEAKAIRFLNFHYKMEFIHPKFLSPENKDFRK